MKKVYLFLSLILVCFTYGQNKPQPLVILDAKKIGFMDEVKNTLESINPNDISTMTVYKDANSMKYGSDSGVIIITTKKFILDTFYKNNIENTPLKLVIPSAEYLSKIGIISDKPKNKNQAYDELLRYIDTNTVNNKIEKIGSIVFIKPVDSQKLNPDWKFGAIEINAAE
ncbi:TonB-dependent receptor plug domain-containing protein [Flavobacterium sp. LS1R49]|uniref:TonB-dependent receptor plug domain-containing protein n=1 Tax=Flavobacterium shii TaxID=2987687 RepID=A0A9X3C6D8_9FLAO|nr:TonB-dependent receptor plug domain-containing protein [Flavobacterium shii]MCV9926413.1 TonB-dependent receptor plug domain-containing protein [Flavobacterium shii]